MIGLDTNIVIYGMVSSVPQHAKALAWFNKNQEALALSPVSVGETLRLLTHPKVFPKPLDLTKAVAALAAFLSDFRVSVLEEDPDWWTRLPDLLADFPGLRGNAVYDARIALCFKFNGVRQVCTHDAEFKKYGFLKVLTL